MSKRSIVAVGIVTVLSLGGAAILTARDTRAAPAPAPVAGTAPFAGKSLIVIPKDRNQTVTLERAEVRSLGGRPYVMGRAVDVSPSLQLGKVTWVPLEDILQLIEVEEAEKGK